ncbi:MAG: Holliday junction resolvase RuvX [Acidimicrobiales bacterium]
MSTRAGGAVVALDLGSRRIGVAVTGGRRLAFPRPAITRSGDRATDLAAIRAVVEESGATVVVVGLPLSLDGGHGPAARRALEETETLGEGLADLGVAVESFDERLTTVSADAALSAAGRSGRERRQAVDSAAAAVLLQAWLDAR